MTATHDEHATIRELSVEDAFQFAATQLRHLITTHAGRTPTYTTNGHWVLDNDRWAPNWNGGFLAGMLWILSRRTGEAWWLQQAKAYTLALEPRKNDTGTHDIGFLLEPSFGRWYDYEHDEHARDVLTTGGRTMAGRMQYPGGYLRTWVDAGSTFIDVMMNVGIILRAAEYSNDPKLKEVALRHSETTRRYLVRGDGSTLHEGWFDTTTGEFLRAATHQGARSDSSWARGQAWAIYGFSTVFRHTGQLDMLTTAQRCADFYISQTTTVGVPPNDWTDANPEPPFESSASAIAAAGMLHLANALDTHGAATDAVRYRDYANLILHTLRSTRFLAVDTAGWEGIVKHAIYHRRNGLGVDESVMWGDHYFLEALDLSDRTSSTGSTGSVTANSVSSTATNDAN
ncbi:MAG: glycoside hydrolase family 88 protein [Nakamurella sp.]